LLSRRYRRWSRARHPFGFRLAHEEPLREHSELQPELPPCVPNVSYDLDCADIGYRTVRVIDSDPYGFDGDGDTYACE
jgi:hypothetical protein